MLGQRGTSTVWGGVSKTYTLGYTYNGELLDVLRYPTISQSNPDIIIKYAYDALGRALGVNRTGTSTYYARSFTYYKNDQVKGLQFGNGLIGNYTYDNLSRPSTITLNNGATTMISLTDTYNNTGTVASVVGTVNSATVNEQYKYDPLCRLTNSSVVSSGSTTSVWYEYDNVGNRVRQKLNNMVTTYTYNTVNNTLTASSATGTSIAYSYDRNGNLKPQNVTTGGTVRWTYTWDAANHLLKVTNSTGQALYAYDGTGRSVEAVEGSSTWFYAYRGTEILYTNLLNTNNQAFVFAGGLKIARIVDRTAIYYYHTDALGSTCMITYNDATYVFIDNYQPFGKGNGTPKGSLANTAKDRFTGKPYSTSTGLYYYYHRWYDPSIGRFISQDPLGGRPSDPQSLDRYVYVTDIPTTFTDPTGLQLMYPSRHASCPSIFQDFWGSLQCSIVGPAAVTGGGQGVTGGVGPGIGAIDPTPVGIIIVGALSAYWLYSHWDQLFGNKDTRPALPGGSDGNGGGSVGSGCPTCSGPLTRSVPNSISGFYDSWTNLRPGEQPRTPGEDPSFLHEKPYRGHPKGASFPWAALCTVSGLTGLTLGFFVRAETSDTKLGFPVEGGLIGLAACALAYATWGQ